MVPAARGRFKNRVATCRCTWRMSVQYGFESLHIFHRLQRSVSRPVGHVDQAQAGMLPLPVTPTATDFPLGGAYVRKHGLLQLRYFPALGDARLQLSGQHAFTSQQQTQLQP